MKLRLLLSLILLLCLRATPALAEEVIEAWRGGGFDRPVGVSVNPTDGSCWVADIDSNQVVHLAEDGTELWRGGGFSRPRALCVNPTDGSCWVSQGYWDNDLQQYVDSAVVHLTADGAELWRGEAFDGPYALSVNPTDGSCWVAESHDVVHLSEDGSELWRGVGFDEAYSVSVNPSDGSCWVADTWNDQVVHLAEDGAQLWLGGGFSRPYSVSVNPRDGSCWVVEWGGQKAVHLAEDGTRLWESGVLYSPTCVSVNPADGSSWVVEYLADPRELLHLAEDGTELWRGGGIFGAPWTVSVNPTDGSCWVADRGNGEVVHLAIPGWQPSIFYDVPWYYWAFDEVGACCDCGIVGGYSPTHYVPANPVSRDQMAVFISRSICSPTGEAGLVDYVPPTTPSFTDVPTDFWCYKYIEYAAANSIVGGYEDGTYQPQLALDRGQMAVFIARAIAGDDQSVPDPTGDPSFPDVPADFWSYRHIEYIADQEVAGGYYDGLYHPENPVDRAQMAVFITRAFNLT